MTDQLTVRLPRDLNMAVAAAAKRMRRKRSEIVRLALEQFLAQRPRGTAAERGEDLLGGVDSGVPDLAERHRAYVLESLVRER